MSDLPQIPTTPLEALDGPPREKPFMSQIWAPTIGALTGFAFALLGNWAMKRPLFSTLQFHAVSIAGGSALFTIADNYRDQYYAERDAVLRHYINLHPEDFPPFNRKKYAELLEPWVPIR